MLTLDHSLFCSRRGQEPSVRFGGIHVAATTFLLSVICEEKACVIKNARRLKDLRAKFRRYRFMKGRCHSGCRRCRACGFQRLAAPSNSARIFRRLPLQS